MAASSKVAESAMTLSKPAVSEEQLHSFDTAGFSIRAATGTLPTQKIKS